MAMLGPSCSRHEDLQIVGERSMFWDRIPVQWLRILLFMKLELSFDYFFYLIIQIPTEIQHGSSEVAQSYVIQVEGKGI